MLHYLGQHKTDLSKLPGYESPAASHAIVDAGVTFTYIADANHHLYVVRAHLRGAAAKPAEARAWLGLPPDGDPPPRGDVQFAASVDGDDVVVQAWSAEGEARIPGWRAQRAAAAALADELRTTHPAISGWFHANRITVDGVDIPVMDFVCLECRVDAPVMLAEWQNEDPSSPRRTALRKLGFRKLRVAWTQIFGEVEI
jgi:hypothetical protein